MASSPPASKMGECLRRVELSVLRRLRVTSPQNKSMSEPTPARPVMVMSTLNTIDAGPLRNCAAPAPWSAEAPMTASTTMKAATASPIASAVGRPATLRG